MIKKIFIIILFSFVSIEASALSPQLKLTIGYPAMVIQDNSPAYLDDILVFGFGAQMQMEMNKKDRLSVVIDASYNPKYTNFNFERKNREIDGSASLLTSFYSLTYYFLFNESLTQSYYISLGPTIGIYTLNYASIDNNETSISAVNRVRVRTRGIRISLKIEDRKSHNFYEVVGLYTVQSRLTVIDDATNDAQAISTNEAKNKRKSSGILFNYGIHLF